jgi:hypothetical protein
VHESNITAPDSIAAVPRSWGATVSDASTPRAPHQPGCRDEAPSAL